MTAPQAPLRISRPWPVDAAVLAVLTALALVPLYPVYDDASFWIAAVGGVLLGTAVAIVGALWRWHALIVAAVVVVVYFAFGGALVLRADALFGVVPTLGVLRDLALGVVYAWKQALTLATPVAGFDELGVVPYLSGLVVAALAVGIGIRARRLWALALVPVALLLLLSLAFSTYQAFVPAAVGIAVAGAALAWTAWRAQRGRRAALLADADAAARSRGARRAAAGAVVVAGAMAVGLVGGTAVSASVDRDVLRDHVVPPLELHDYASPLTSFRKYVTDGADSVLFTVKGLPQGAPIRLAALDFYDGIVYQVTGGGGGSGSFTRVGREIATTAEGETAHVEVTVGDLTGVWMPTVGQLTGVAFDGGDAERANAALHYNPVSASAVVTTGLREGDSYAFDAVIPAEPTLEELADATISKVTTPAPLLVPEPVSATVEKAAAAATTQIGQVLDIRGYLATKGFFSHGLEGDGARSRSGHTNDRITELLSAKQMVGDDEQYAVAAALMVSQLGVPVRVVMGFVPAAEGDVVEVTGDDVHAWVEVPVDGHGWVRLAPTPPEDQLPQEETPDQAQKPRALVAQPPDPPQEPVELPPAPPVEEASNEGEDAGPDYEWLWITLRIGGGAIAVLAALLGPSAVLAVLRSRRRKRRERAAATADRIDGGWAEVIDAAVDVGVGVTPGATRREAAATLAEARPLLDLAPLAERADTAVFGAGDPSDAEASAYWADVRTAVRGIEKGATWRGRLRGALLPASVLRRKDPKTPRRGRTTKEMR